MTNFDFLLADEQFAPFADTAIAAEKIFHIDVASAVVGCRRAMEFAVKWMYSVDGSLVMPYQDKLVSLMNTDEFKDIIGIELYKRLNYIRLVGNNANHKAKNITKDQAALALQNLHAFMDFIAYCYGKDYHETKFDISLAEEQTASEVIVDHLDFEKLCEENKALKAELTARRENREATYVENLVNLTEASTRRAYIDVMLTDAGWERGKNWFDEFAIDVMPNKSNLGFADYVLMGDDGRLLAVIEAKKTSVDVAVGRQQAKLYADNLEKRFGRRPIIFLTNGYDTRIWIDQEQGYPERAVSGIYAKRDLEKEFNKMTMRAHLHNARISDDISGRYYQKEAIKAVCEAFDRRNRRKALLVMATGSGKTRTVISLVDVLIKNGWVKNFLFLADRNSLVTQAKRAFHNLLPDVSITNLVEEKDNYNARGVFSTYQTMMGCIDESKDETGGKLFTCGHFDLIVVDEAHRSIYNKYKDIFTYFDALLVGLTATPRDEVGKDTYAVFELEAGVPTYGYELQQAVEDGYLVDYRSIETKLKFMNEGIVYDELTDAEKQQYEELFANENGEIPPALESSALNEWIFNKDTIKQVLNILQTKGLKVNYGSSVGKTIIFAKNHLHAEKILAVWNQEYPEYPAHYCRVIDNYTNYAQSLIDEFSDRSKLPQIAVSVDMLDTGIDVPEILNLVFFKKVMSKAKFWQMIGRGTRLCEDLLDGDDKQGFYIFDFCSNFEFFRVNGKGKEVPAGTSVQQKLFDLKAEIVYKLQDLAYQTEELTAFRRGLVKELVDRVCALNRDNFAVKQHLRYVDLFGSKKTYEALTYEDIQQIASEISPLVLPETDEYTAVRFDALMYQIELAYLVGKKAGKPKGDLMRKVSALTHYGTIPAVTAQKEFLDTLLHTDYVARGGINEFENIRTKLRDLMKYIGYEPQAKYETNFADTITGIEENDSDMGQDYLVNYKKKVNYYIREHENNPAIAKLKTNKPLSKNDVAELEKILWSELGTKEDYQKEFGDMPLGELVRSIVGLDMAAAKEAFSQFIDEANLDSRQIYFVNQIINYIVKNGMMKDLSVLQGSPFADKGSVVEVFEDDNLWRGVRQAIDAINKNAAA